MKHSMPQNSGVTLLENQNDFFLGIEIMLEEFWSKT